jgi:hypothetical protein
MNTIQKWEYLPYEPTNVMATLSETIDDFGLDGWELATSYSTLHNHPILIFKRPIQEQERGNELRAKPPFDYPLNREQIEKETIDGIISGMNVGCYADVKDALKINNLTGFLCECLSNSKQQNKEQ